MTRKLRTLTDPGEIEGHPGKGQWKGRELLDPKPVAVPVRPIREQLGPLDQMYANIRAREKLAADAAYTEDDDEAFDFDVPEELDQFLSAYEDNPLEELLGTAFRDPAVQGAIKAALMNEYGEPHQKALQKLAEARQQAPRQASTPASLPGDKAAADPPKGGEPTPPAKP